MERLRRWRGPAAVLLLTALTSALVAPVSCSLALSQLLSPTPAPNSRAFRCVCALQVQDGSAAPPVQLLDAALAPVPSGGKLWVLLVAGSSGYMNYRHQADVCHAYQVRP